ncbi:alpha/beta fold hydrolase [Solicola gregarius]|uniref:Alpha/beta hydrolase n=1 Tax=Solicola gregarius TaxID=2908642 RepID=A0AA46YL24_9ACTN|nr:alpha/beta hydrolase [Solicola gregarius]UYM04453.1 alpha/beta hydrolase [Solicola gregarius]
MQRLPGAEHRWVDIDGVRLHVAELGSGPPVMLVHGFPQNWYAWRDVATLLARDHRVIMPDLRGFGCSDAPRRGYDTRTRVNDLEAVLEHLDLPEVLVCGHEWGGWAALWLAMRSPARVTGVVTLNVQHPWPLHRRLVPSAWRYWYTAALELPFIGRTVLRRVPAFTRYLLGRGRTADPVVLRENAELMRRPDRARAGEKLHRAFIFGDILPLALNRYRRRTLTRPTILLAGTRDPVVRPAAVLGVHPRQAELDVRVVDGGHYLHEDAPGPVADAIRELEQHARRPPNGDERIRAR